jgi:hypothetical protein
VPATEVARRARHGVAVLLKIYAHCIDGQTDAANRRITDVLGAHAERAGDGSPDSIVQGAAGPPRDWTTQTRAQEDEPQAFVLIGGCLSAAALYLSPGESTRKLPADPEMDQPGHRAVGGSSRAVVMAAACHRSNAWWLQPRSPTSRR